MLITTKIFCSDCNFYTFGGRIQGKGLNSFSHILMCDRTKNWIPDIRIK